ncbi:MAG TPA: D-aminoacyl-tRNA deacylase [Anaerolineales bacterium]|nr:D-aminoacyl-tRNA deacylase [Anaerolineales bacterium]
MRLVVQRVKQGSVTVAGETVGAIDDGLVVLIGVRRGDTGEQADWLADKTARLRIFEDDAGKLNRSVLDSGGRVLAISQFTLYGDATGGNRPSFIEAARPEDAEPLITRYIERLRALGVQVETGRFRAEMQVLIHNDGPVTIVLDR